MSDAAPAVTDSAPTAAVRLTRTDIAKLFREVVADAWDEDLVRVSENDALLGDQANHDSMSILQILEGIEAALAELDYQIRIEDTDLEDIRTVRQAIDFITAKLGL